MSLSDGPFWRFTFDELRFEVPFTREMIVLDGWFPLLITVGSSIAYLLCIFFIFPLFKNISKDTLKTLSVYHYGALCAYSFFVFAATTIWMIQSGNFTSYEAFLCQPIPDWLRVISITFSISKVWEWIDTLILMMKQKSLKDIGFLHLYHHCTTLFLFVFVMNIPGDEKSGMLMNGFVHWLMYHHFAWRLPMWARPIITAAQIFQLSSATIHHHVATSTCPAFATYATDYPISNLIPYIFVPVYCLFFLKFFAEQYICKAPKKTVDIKKTQ